MDKKSKKNIIFGIAALLFILLTLLGIAFAYYRTKVIENAEKKTVKLTSETLKIEYQNESAYIEASKIEPGYSATKTFEVKNYSSESINYSIIFDNITNTFTRTQDWTYTLTKRGVSAPIASGKLIDGNIQFLVEEISVSADTVDYYTLEINYANLSDVDQSEDMGKTLKLRINIEEPLKVVTWDNALNGTLIYALKSNNEVGQPQTVPGQVASLNTEAVLATTEDDFGTSYYFRGNVQNNYVTYSGMCWRIVRIQGNGDIKLALADRDNACGTANGYETNDYDGAFLANPSTYSFQYKANWAKDESDLVYENSTIASTISAWAGIGENRTFIYGSNSSNTDEFSNEPLDLTQLSRTPEWCVDSSVYTTVSDTSYLGAYGRLYSVTEAAPTLRCNMTGLNSSAAKKYTGSAIGILSVDEVAFAGATYEQRGVTYSHYLKTNAASEWYWTLSPYLLRVGRYSNMWYILESGAMFGGVANNYGTIRPAIILKSGVTLSTKTDYIQDGTIDKPYVIS